MIKEALEYIVGLQKQPYLLTDQKGRQYSDTDLEAIKEPTPTPVHITTLQGLADLVGAGVEAFDKEAVVVHVESYASVRLIAKASDKWGRRECYIQAELPDVQQFRFGEFMDHERFLIAVQSLFVKNPDREYLIKTASTLEAGMTTTSQDDGISQRVNVNAGVTLKTTEVLKSLLLLAPFRTFREVEQPASEFVFRVQGKDPSRVPSCALFEADGGGWKIEAVKNVAEWLRSKVEAAIPIVS